MNNKEIDASKIFSWFFTIVVILVLITTFRIYKKHYFGDFIKAENQMHISSFLRDNEVKYSKHDSYKIESPDYNDAVFYKEIKVKPNTPYKVTCMVKTENVEVQEENTDAGAMICLLETTEVSNSIVGTNEWQKLTFMFNSKDKESVKIAFRLGGNLGNCKGTAWFSDFKVEEGLTDSQDSNWNMACFILKNIVVEDNVKISMDLNDVENIKGNMKRFAESCKILSENKMNVSYDIYEINEPITTLSYSEEHKYHVSPQDVEEIISSIIAKEEYDHIICVVRMGDSNHGIEVNAGDWIGLGGMDLYGIGFSTIRLATNKNSYTYEFKIGMNTFPEETYLHEFLHSLERNSEEFGYEVPELHSYETYGYKDEGTVGLKQWYADYMNCKILDTKTNTYIGLNPILYSLKPIHESDFTYPIELEFYNEPENLIEEIREIFKVIKENI